MFIRCGEKIEIGPWVKGQSMRCTYCMRPRGHADKSLLGNDAEGKPQYVNHHIEALPEDLKNVKNGKAVLDCATGALHIYEQ